MNNSNKNLSDTSELVTQTLGGWGSKLELVSAEIRRAHDLMDYLNEEREGVENVSNFDYITICCTDFVEALHDVLEKYSENLPPEIKKLMFLIEHDLRRIAERVSYKVMHFYFNSYDIKKEHITGEIKALSQLLKLILSIFKNPEASKLFNIEYLLSTFSFDGVEFNVSESIKGYKFSSLDQILSVRTSILNALGKAIDPLAKNIGIDLEVHENNLSIRVYDDISPEWPVDKVLIPATENYKLGFHLNDIYVDASGGVKMVAYLAGHRASINGLADDMDNSNSLLKYVSSKDNTNDNFNGMKYVEMVYPRS